MKELTDAGWIPTERGRWTHPTWAPKYAQSAEKALRTTEHHARWDKGLSVFEKYRCQAGYGYVIYEYKTEKDGGRNIFRHEDPEVVKRALELLNQNPDAEMEINGKQVKIRGYTTDAEFPYVLVVEEKHGTRYFHVPTIAKLGQACLSLLKERADWMVDEEPTTAPQPEMSKEDIQRLPDQSTLRKAAEEQWQRFEAAQKHDQARIKRNADIRRALETKNGGLAYDILIGRRDYEYERIRIEEFSQPDVDEAA